MSSIGLLGGTFDPVHNGHLELAERSSRECDLEKVLFIPSASPPHKSVDEITPFDQRVEMLHLALAGRSRFALSEVEADLAQPSYTIDMLEALLPVGMKDDYYFIIGSDAFLEVKTWKHYEKVLHRLHFIVIPRKGYNRHTLKDHIASLGYRYAGTCWYSSKYDRKLHCFEKPAIDVSSTHIRKMRCGSEDMLGVVPKSVCEYIVSNRLYDCSR